MARKNNMEAIIKFLLNEIETNKKMAAEYAQRYSYSNALIAQVRANTCTHVLSMIEAFSKAKVEKVENEAV